MYLTGGGGGKRDFEKKKQGSGLCDFKPTFQEMGLDMFLRKNDREIIVP